MHYKEREISGIQILLLILLGDFKDYICKNFTAQDLINYFERRIL